MGTTDLTNTAAASNAKHARHSDLLIDQVVGSWSPGPASDPDSVVFRSELGLPTDQPIVMTGHQAAFWHAGILTKYLAARALADRETAAGRPVTTAWCVPDHVADSPCVVAFPAPARPGDAGRWERREADLLDVEGDLIGRLPPSLADAQKRLAGVDAPRVADRQIRAHASILGDRIDLTTDCPIVLASRLHETTAFAELVAWMTDDPRDCVDHYNAAAAAYPDAGVRPLAITDRDDGIELPLWRIADDGAAVPIMVRDLASTPADRIRPRALLFTGLLRARACDLFIHGTGGGVYDRVTERWLADWLGWTLAPAGVATATLTLDLGIPDVSRNDLHRARWLAHHARHNPGVLGAASGLADAEAHKQALVREIREADPADRERLYFEMHAWLESVRGDHAESLAALVAEADSIEAGLADRAIASDRTWPWMLHSDGDLHGLRDAVASAINAGADA